MRGSSIHHFYFFFSSYHIMIERRKVEPEVMDGIFCIPVYNWINLSHTIFAENIA